MADVYLTYAQADRASAQSVARALEKNGWSVAWDFESADDIADATEAALAEARAVVALWTPEASGARWVETEATLARKDARLVLARIGDARLPRRLRRDPVVDLTSWDGSAPGAAALVAAVEAVLEDRPPPPRSVAPTPVTAGKGRRAAVDPSKLLEGPRLELAGHEAEVYDLAWSADGLLLATASADRTARVWDAVAGRAVATLAGHTDEVNDVSLAPDGHGAATASDDGSVRLWAAPRWDQTRVLTHHAEPVYWVAHSPAGRLAASAAGDGLVTVWRAEGGKVEWEFGHEAGVSTARWLPDGTVLVSGDDEGDLNLWDVESGDLLRAFQAHDSAVADLAVSPTDTVVASSSEGGQLAAWDMVDGSMLWWASDLAGTVVGMAFSPDGEFLASADDEGITIWQARSGEPVAAIEDPAASRLEFAPNGQALAWASGRSVRVVTAG